MLLLDGHALPDGPESGFPRRPIFGAGESLVGLPPLVQKGGECAPFSRSREESVTLSFQLLSFNFERGELCACLPVDQLLTHVEQDFTNVIDCFGVPPQPGADVVQPGSHVFAGSIEMGLPHG